MKKNTTPVVSGAFAKLTNVIGFKSLQEKTSKIIQSEFITSDLYDLNKIVGTFGITLKEKDGISVLPFTQIEGIRKDIDFTKPLPLFNKKKGDILVIHVSPSAAFTYTIKNVSGTIVQTIKLIAGEPSNIVRIQGSENFYTLEGNTNV